MQIPLVQAPPLMEDPISVSATKPSIRASLLSMFQPKKKEPAGTVSVQAHLAVPDGEHPEIPFEGHLIQTYALEA